MKKAKEDCLSLKKNHQAMRDDHAINQESTVLRNKRHREKEKVQWKKLKQVFRKKVIKSISTVKYYYNGNVIRTSGQIEIESAVIRENATRFKLEYNSPLFYKSNLDKVGIFG